MKMKKNILGIDIMKIKSTVKFLLMLISMLLVIGILYFFWPNIYYNVLVVPQFSPDTAINEMQNSRGLLNSGDKKLLNSVKYYAYHGNQEVIFQLLQNLEYEVQPLDSWKSNKRVGGYINVVGQSYRIVSNYDGYYRHVARVFHEYIWQLDVSKLSEKYVWNLLRLWSEYHQNYHLKYPPVWWSYRMCERDVAVLLKMFPRFHSNSSISRLIKEILPGYVSIHNHLLQISVDNYEKAYQLYLKDGGYYLNKLCNQE